jgi:hypothetical protein
MSRLWSIPAQKKAGERLRFVVVLLDPWLTRAPGGSGFGFVTFDKYQTVEDVLRRPDHNIKGKGVEVPHHTSIASCKIRLFSPLPSRELSWAIRS